MRFGVLGTLDDQPPGHPRMDCQPPPRCKLEEHVLPAPPDRGDRVAGESLLEHLALRGDGDLAHRDGSGRDRLAADGVGQSARDGLDFRKLGHPAYNTARAPEFSRNCSGPTGAAITFSIFIAFKELFLLDAVRRIFMSGSPLGVQRIGGALVLSAALSGCMLRP